MRARSGKRLDISRLPGRSSAKTEAEAENIAARASSEMDI
jgi:hypothetical protein